MQKEIATLNAYEIQDKLWGRFYNPAAFSKRVEQAQKGHLPFGRILTDKPSESFQRRILGQFAPRVALFSATRAPVSKVVAAGGWCAIRTKDVENFGLKRQVIVSPLTGQEERISSVEQVCEWIRTSACFDQIVESIGPIKASEYVAISERRLWTERMAAKLSDILQRRISERELNLLRDSITIAEATRIEMTRRYLSQVLEINPQTLPFSAVYDSEIWQEIQEARDETLSSVDLSVAKLKAMYPQDPAIGSASLVWAMYSQPYFDVLRKKGYIKNPLVLISEPIFHAVAESESENEVARRIYQQKGIYLRKGVNSNTGFVGYLECINNRGQNTRKFLSTGEVPNITNQDQLFEPGNLLDPERQMTLEPQKNELFLWGLNLFPYGKIQKLLIELVEIQESFRQSKQEVANKQLPQNDTRQIVEQLRQEYLKMVLDKNMQVATQLKYLLGYLTEGVSI